MINNFVIWLKILCVPFVLHFVAIAVKLLNFTTKGAKFFHEGDEVQIIC
jgi:hypothetical protein